uniref:Uncharacterized protein n=1 Tax=Oryza punctata TaxID=4537 RepID=A0A0E0MHS1_ORYPU
MQFKVTVSFKLELLDAKEVTDPNKRIHPGETPQNLLKPVSSPLTEPDVDNVRALDGKKYKVFELPPEDGEITWDV